MTTLTSIQTAQQLLSNGIVKLSPDQPFTFASGIKSPIYCDCRAIMSLVDFRKNIAVALAHKIQVEYPDVQVISGVATGSIAIPMLVADILGLPLVYWRKPKGHGLDKSLEGIYEMGQKVVVVEDMVSTGGSSLTAIESLRSSGLQVLGAIVTYSHQMQQVDQNYTKANTRYVSLAGLSDILEYAQTSGSLTVDQVEIIKDWKSDPAGWGARHGFIS